MMDKKMSIPHQQMKELIESCLNSLGKKYAKPEAVELVLATGLVESRYKYIKQIGSGIASSYWQIEGDTAKDCVDNYLSFRPSLAKKCAEVSQTPASLWVKGTKEDWENVLKYNMYCAIIMCRLKYWRSPKPLPKTTLQMAHMWKDVYNTEGGAGTVAHFMEIVGKHI
jgi:hypothetical protein